MTCRARRHGTLRFLSAAAFTTTQAYTDGTHSYGFYVASGDALPALASSRASWRIVDHGPGVARSVLIALNTGDSKATLGTALVAPTTGPRDALTPMLSITRFDASGSIISGRGPTHASSTPPARGPF